MIRIEIHDHFDIYYRISIKNELSVWFSLNFLYVSSFKILESEVIHKKAQSI